MFSTSVRSLLPKSKVSLLPIFLSLFCSFFILFFIILFCFVLFYFILFYSIFRLINLKIGLVRLASGGFVDGNEECIECGGHLSVF